MIKDIEVNYQNIDIEKSTEYHSDYTNIRIANLPKYIGRDGKTKWDVYYTPSHGHTRRRIITDLPGPKTQEQNVTSPLES